MLAHHDLHRGGFGSYCDVTACLLIAEVDAQILGQNLHAFLRFNQTSRTLGRWQSSNVGNRITEQVKSVMLSSSTSLAGGPVCYACNLSCKHECCRCMDPDTTRCKHIIRTLVAGFVLKRDIAVWEVE